MYRRLPLAVGVLAVITCLVVFRLVITHWLQGEFGFRRGDSNSPHYLFWSGIGSDLAYLSVVTGALLYYRKENCRRTWCPFLGRHEFTDPTDGVMRKLCWMHHPDVQHKTLSDETIGKIQEKRRRFYLGKQPGKG
jgi:hypothetical protein